MLLRTDDGGFSVTICQDQAGLDESTLRAKEWIANNAAGSAASPARVTVGDVIAQF